MESLILQLPYALNHVFAIFSCRREAEITRMQLDDYDETNKLWKIRDLKNPNGSKGNHKEFSVTFS